ncbi:SPOR domain-containing protein [Cyclonatronum proteinivorum]|uniref:SPOR domain-containing protein n=1 Tax=Cyclonatronum proteinivorum TaxID=1457365 RepID=UPI0013E07E9B|nr:SPOR domain-containing protein [Cyclonatronum proteinivorum]
MRFFSKKEKPVLAPSLPLLLLLLFIAAGCASVAEVAEPEEAPAEEIVEAPAAFSTTLSTRELAELRLQPTDRFRTFELTVPEAFQISEEELQQTQSNRGFRIQLLTTENVAYADSLMLEYYDWAAELDELPFDVMPEAYVTFRQPFYRVRVGDFRRRSDANLYLAILRTRFPGAWVVIDTIDPSLAP